MQQNTLTRVGVWGVRLLALAAIGLSGYLLYASLTTTPVAGCGWSSFDCDSVLASRWAKWFGAPVAAGGLLVYVAVLAGSVMIGSRGSAAATGWRILEGAVPLAAGGGIWFVGVQLFALQSFCLYCVLTHTCGLIIAAVVLAMRLTTDRESAPAPAIGAVGLGGPVPIESAVDSGPPELGLPPAVGVIALVVLITGQVFGPAPALVQTVVEADDLVNVLSFDDTEGAFDVSDEQIEETPPETDTPDAVQPAAGRSRPARREGGQRIVKLLKGGLSIDAYDHPVLGSPDAEHMLVELMDYACPHCRDFHKLMEEALERFEGRVGVIVMPVPGEVLCNPYVKVSRPKARGACDIAKVSLASASLAPAAFPDMHHWLLQGDRLPKYTSALIEAQRHAGREKLSRAVRDDSGEIKAQIDRYVNLMGELRQYSATGRIGLPTQIFPNRLVSGPPESVDEVCKLWASEFGVAKPVDSTPLPF